MLHPDILYIITQYIALLILYNSKCMNKFMLLFSEPHGIEFADIFMVLILLKGGVGRQSPTEKWWTIITYWGPYVMYMYGDTGTYLFLGPSPNLSAFSCRRTHVKHEGISPEYHE